MAEIDHELKIGAPPDRVFRALTTAEGIRSWKTPDVEGTGAVGSEWRFGFAGRPEFRWRVVASEPDRRVLWECTRGPGDSAGTTLEFTLAPTEDGRTLLACKHAGWPGTHGHFRKCNTTWGVLLYHLKQHAEANTTTPAFP